MMASISTIYDECMKKECFLTINDFGEVSTYDSLPALARLVQRLIIMQPGSYPDDPDMGVGIENYQFEFMDINTLTEINEKIKTQINRYIPNNNVLNILVDVIENETTRQKNTIGVLINFSKSVEGKDNMILTFDKIGKTGKIESKIYI